MRGAAARTAESATPHPATASARARCARTVHGLTPEELTDLGHLRQARDCASRDTSGTMVRIAQA